MSNLTEGQIKTANWLLRYSRGQNEDHIRKRIGSLLESLQVDYELSYRSPYASGPADIYLPRRRTIIETKALGLADDPNKRQARKNDETPKQQLDRYVYAEIAYELNSLPLEDVSNRPWTGILTDGQVWHVWTYPHEENSVSTTAKDKFRPQTPESLVELLRQIIVKGDPVGKPWIPLNPRDLFSPQLEVLREIHAKLPKPAIRPTETKRQLWLEMLRTSSMEPESEAARQRLFVAHSFLVALARGVIHTLANPGKTPEAHEILGDGFVAWIVDSNRGRQWASDFLEQIHKYEWRRRPGDVLRPLYEKFVDESDRKAFGEFYTPDWLAEMIVNDVCDDDWCTAAVEKVLAARRTGDDIEGVGVLDPTCGSGTFLYHAVKRLLSTPTLIGVRNLVKAEVVCSLVHGIDVHPVAAEITRATVLRALPDKLPQGDADLNIHEGDALLIHGDDENSLFRPIDGEIRIETPKGIEVFLPRALIERPSFADDLRRIVSAAVKEQGLPGDIVAGESESIRKGIEKCYEQFKEIIKDEGNSVWTWYIRNITGPYRLSETKVDRIVANPPWVTMAHIQVESRKRSLEHFAARDDIDLWGGGKQAPHFDIAQLFIKRARQLYLANPNTDPAAWLVKKAALKAGSWAKFREWHQGVLKQTLDLEALQPFGGGDARRCCVLYEGQPSDLMPKLKKTKSLEAKVTGSKPAPEESLEEVWDRLTFKASPIAIAKGESDYLGSKNKPLFRQGATITPKVLTVVSKFEKTNRRNERSQRLLRITTTRSQHKPWSTIEAQEGDVPELWVRELIISKDILPFSTSPDARLHALIPTNDSGGLDRSASEVCDFWGLLERDYQENMGAGKSTPKNLIDRMDYGSVLSSQLGLSGESRTMVVYPSSGDIMRACRLRPGEAIVDSTLYYFDTLSASEAAYLVALMNAPCLNDAFVQSRDSGRHFHQHPWRKVPIRRYDKNKPSHVALAELGTKAEKITTSWLSCPEGTSVSLGQVGLSSRLRDLLKNEGIFAKIDKIVQDILPDQALT